MFIFVMFNCGVSYFTLLNLCALEASKLIAMSQNPARTHRNFRFKGHTEKTFSSQEIHVKLYTAHFNHHI